jgi:hypothetical protein
MNLLALTAESYSRSFKYLKHGPDHLLMYVLGRFNVVRSLVVWLYGLRTTQAPTAEKPALTQTVDIEEAACRVRQDGFYAGLTLRPEVVERLLAFSSMAICFGDSNLDFPFRYVDREMVERQCGRQFKLGNYNYALQASPVLQALASDPQLLGIARSYLHTEPVLIGVRMWWSFACPADAKQQMEAGQGFHYDLDGYRAIAFFFYLTNVGPSNGAHIYVRGSHVKKLLRHKVSLYKGRDEAEINSAYRPEDQMMLCGPAGAGFAEDIFGFHKGLHPESGDRLIVQLRFGLRDYGTGRHD